MAGIYLHIPFCRQACNYCDFHFSTTLKYKGELVQALLKEIELRKNEATSTIHTIYFGGGTPSLLSADELNLIFQALNKHFTIDPKSEITLEANPDDLGREYLNTLKHTPVNRLSIGVQSFREEDLRYMNRAHTAGEAITCIQHAADAGFHNLTIDLIYGTPGLTLDDWESNLQKALSLPVNHLSSYCLTVEEGTALAYQVKTGASPAVNDELAAEQFRLLLSMTEAAGMPWYEISNFAKQGFESKHNSAYWKGEPYIGIGPSAHSFDGSTRSWNIINNQAYIRSLAEMKIPRESETLTTGQRVNEKILTALRTRKGLTLQDIRNIDPSAVDKILGAATPYLEKGWLMIENGKILFLTPDGLLFADAVAADLFI